MVEMRTFNRLTGSFCTTSSKPATSALVTGVQFPNAFSDPKVSVFPAFFSKKFRIFFWKEKERNRGFIIQRIKFISTTQKILEGLEAAVEGVGSSMA